MTDSQEKIVFFISPIGKPDSPERKRSDAIKNSLIEPACDGFEYKCIRADEMPEPGRIDKQVIDLLLNADLVIADLSDHNPNVFYELAVRHACQKPVILLIEDGQSIPFDIKTHRTIFYDINNGPKFVQAQKELRSQIETVNQDAFIPDSPIRDSLIGNITIKGDDDLKEVLSIVRTNSGILYEFQNDFNSEIKYIRNIITINQHRILNINRNLATRIGGLEDWGELPENIQDRLNKLKRDIINILSEEPEGLTISDICERLNLSPITLRRSMSQLLRTRMISRYDSKYKLVENKITKDESAELDEV